MATTEHYGTGRRKTSTARVFLRPGTGKFTINDRSLESNFPTETLRLVSRQPFVVTETVERFEEDLTDACRIYARAVVEYQADLRLPLRKAGLMTRDPRAKERKKYGMAGARKRFQFSKR